MYDHEKSKYCYPSTSVLINIPGFKEQKQLDAFERIVTVDRLRILGLKPIKGKFDLKYLCDIHYFIFKDVYPFAGKLREEDISKGSFRFANVQFLADQTKELLNKIKQENFLKDLSLDDFSSRLTYFMTELNVLHPFREGNGRTQREFIRCLALESGYLVDWSSVEATTILDVMIQSPFDSTALHSVLHAILTQSNKIN